MKPRRFLPFSAAITCVLTVSAHAADVTKASNTSALNLAGAWSSAPTASDVAVWNSTVTATNAAGSNTITSLGGNQSWQGIRIGNVTGTVNTNTLTSGVQITGGSGLTLSLGTAGIDMSAATQALLIQSSIALTGSQTWNIANANTQNAPFAGSGVNSTLGEDLMFAASAAATMNLGGFTLGTSGLGSIGVSSGYTISNGTLNLANANTWFQSGSGRATVLSSNLTVSVAANSNLRLRANSGGVSSAAAIGVSGTGSKLQLEINNGTATMAQSGALTFGNGSTFENILSTSGAMTIGAIATSGTVAWNVNVGGSTGAAHVNGIAVSGNLTGNGTINYANTAAATAATGQVRLSGDNSAFNGTFNINGGSGNRNLRLNSATSGSSAATWSVAAANTLQVDGVAVNLGTLNGAGTVTNSHASNVAAITVGAGTFSGAITNGTPALGMSLTKNTVGNLTLSGNGNTYTGNTLISGGKLAATQTGAISASSAISVNGSGAIFDGTGTFGAVSVADALGTVQNGNGTSGALTLSSVNFAGDATLNIVTSSATPSARVIVTGALTTTPASGTITVNGSGSWSNGVNNLLSYGSGGALLGDFTAGAFTGFTSRQSSGGLSLSGNNLFLTVNGDSPKWTGSDNGNWVVGTTGDNGNWQLITAATKTDFIANDIVLFDDTAPGSKTVNVSAANVSVASADFNTSTAYALTGGFGISAGTIAKNGSGSLTIENANTTSGGVQLNAGTLNVNHASALGSGALTIAGGTTLDNTSGSAKVATNAQNWNGDFTFTGTNDLTLGAATMNASRQVTVSAGTLAVGGISGSGLGLTKAGAGTLAVGASSYNGATTINVGTLKATSITSFTTTSSVTLADTAGVTLDLNGNSQTIAFISGGGTTGGNVVLGNATLTTGSTSNTTFSGALSGAGGLTKIGSGTFTLAGSKGDYTGTTSISGGTLDVGTLSGAFGTGNVVGSNTVFLQGNGSTTTGITGGSSGIGARGGNLTVNVGGAGAQILLNSSGTNGLGGMNFGSATSDSKVIVENGISINNFNSTRTFTVNTGVGTASAEITGVVANGTGNGDTGIVKAGTGDLILSNANTITGSTSINAGRIVLGHNQALQFTSLTTDNVGSVSASGFTTPTIGGLTGSTALGTFISSGYSDITSLTLAPQTGRSLSYSGVIADGATGMNLVKSGAGTQTLNAANTYTGSTTINGGTLTLGAAGSIDNTSGVSLGTVGTFDVSAKSGYTVSNLSGSGSVKGALTVSTQLAIGNSAGTASFNAGLTLDSATYVYEMTGGASPELGSADLGNVTGTLTITAGSILDLVELGTYTVGNKFTLFGYTTGVIGTFDGLADGAQFDDDLANQWMIDYDDTTAGLNGGSGTSFVTVTAIPEPNVAALLGGLGAVALLRRRRK
jgi:autotransporter-associated beta strand protein